jgi:hypothetical protein
MTLLILALLTPFLFRRYEEHIGGSPYTYVVSEGPTDPASSLLSFDPSIKAGEAFRVVIETYDVHNNPTAHRDDAFECTLDNEAAVEVTRADDGIVVFSQPITVAGSHTLTIVHVPTDTEVAYSPITFDVSPAAADAPSSKHNLGNTTRIVSNPDATITVQVFPRDAYGNKVVMATGFKVMMTVRDQEQLSTLNPDEDYLGVIPIPEDLDATITFEFTLDGVLIGDGEVVEIVVARPEVESDPTNTYIAVGVSSFLLLVAAITYRRYQLRTTAQLAKVNLDMEDQHKHFSSQKKELEAEKEELEEEMRLKKHSEEELKVMVAALEAVSKERQDELKEVMMESKELKIEKLLGKGG